MDMETIYFTSFEQSSLPKFKTHSLWPECELHFQIILTFLGKKISKRNLGTQTYCLIVREGFCNQNFIIYERNQKDANLQVNLLFIVSSTCFGRCLGRVGTAFPSIQDTSQQKLA
jgi:hypothetical protein